MGVPTVKQTDRKTVVFSSVFDADYWIQQQSKSSSRLNKFLTIFKTLKSTIEPRRVLALICKRLEDRRLTVSVMRLQLVTRRRGSLCSEPDVDEVSVNERLHTSVANNCRSAANNRILLLVLEGVSSVWMTDLTRCPHDIDIDVVPQIRIEEYIDVDYPLGYSCCLARPAEQLQVAARLYTGRMKVQLLYYANEYWKNNRSACTYTSNVIWSDLICTLAHEHVRACK